MLGVAPVMQQAVVWPAEWLGPIRKGPLSPCLDVLLEEMVPGNVVPAVLQSSRYIRHEHPWVACRAPPVWVRQVVVPVGSRASPVWRADCHSWQQDPVGPAAASLEARAVLEAMGPVVVASVRQRDGLYSGAVVLEVPGTVAVLVLHKVQSAAGIVAADVLALLLRLVLWSCALSYVLGS